MGTNRRSRRRSAARILNSSTQNKRQKCTSELDSGSNGDKYPPPDSPVTLPDHQPAPENLHNTDLTENMSSPISYIDATIASPASPSIEPFQNENHTFTSAEICSFELMDLLDNAGCPLNTYEQVVCLLRKQEKLGFSYSRAHSRDKLLSRLRQKFHCPQIHSTVISKCEVFSFPFVDMLQDLVDTAVAHLHMITPSSCGTTNDDELWNTGWMCETFKNSVHMNFNHETDIMLPIIIYLDKTGTDVLQRYSLEPMLFTTAALNRESRENRRFWRHLGFIPSSKITEDSKESLQFYHKCLEVILGGLKMAQQNKPVLQIKSRTGTIRKLNAHLPIMIILGDQLSQDTLCCRRKANAGGAGRVHRSCMCSFLSSDDHEGKCETVPVDLIHHMIQFSTRSLADLENIIDQEVGIDDKTSVKNVNSSTMRYFRKQKQMFNVILSKPFTTHPVVSAFHGMDFGAWKSGVYDATFDDFMHSCEEGLMENIGTTLFDGLVCSEAEKVESLMIPLLTSSRSSVRSTYPRWRLQKGFSRQTLMTMGERVGSVFSIALALHHRDVAKIFQDGHARQRTKYLSFPQTSKADEREMFYQPYIHSMSAESCKHTLTHLHRHGFDINVLESMDPFQINQLIYHTGSIFEKTTYPESYPNFKSIDGMYIDLGAKLSLEKRLLNKVVAALAPKKENMFRRHRTIPVATVTPKHHCRKPKQKGDGSTAAFLGTHVSSLIMLLEYALCYHSFCKYSSSLPPPLRQDIDLIDYSGRSLVAYFSRMIYRGDATVDSRTAKIHAQRRLGVNYRSLGNVMHGCCEVGERLLKTEAKKISRTAQQRGSTTFERQTCSRILDRHLFDKMRVALAGSNCESKETTIAVDKFSRHQPHFLLSRADNSVVANDRKGNKFVPNESTGRPSESVCSKLLEIETDMDTLEIYNEVILRDGSYVRAFPNYRGEGPWFDFANIQWEDDRGEAYFLPARCLAFYKKNGNCMALIHSVDAKSDGRVAGCRNSILISHFKMEYSRNGDEIFHSINCASIDSAVLCFSLGSYSPSIMVVRPRNEWALAWYEWNKYLRIRNSNRTSSKPMIDLGDEDAIIRVRTEITKCIKEYGRSQCLPS